MKLNFGCGLNKLEGWRNFDINPRLGEFCDISKKLPFENNYASHIFAEHVVEHITYEQSLVFFNECARVLKPKGLIRIHVPSVELIYRYATKDYIKFTTKWQPEETMRGALYNIMFCHGHKMIWSEFTLIPVMHYCGFAKLSSANVNSSSLSIDFEGISGHGKVISEDFNDIETLAVEGEVDK